MDWQSIESNWQQFKIKVKSQWSRLTDRQIEAIGGSRDQLAHEIAASYGISGHAAEWQLSGWQARLTPGLVSARHAKSSSWSRLFAGARSN